MVTVIEIELIAKRPSLRKSSCPNHMLLNRLCECFAEIFEITHCHFMTISSYYRDFHFICFCLPFVRLRAVRYYPSRRASLQGWIQSTESFPVVEISVHSDLVSQ